MLLKDLPLARYTVSRVLPKKRLGGSCREAESKHPTAPVEEVRSRNSKIISLYLSPFHFRGRRGGLGCASHLRYEYCLYEENNKEQINYKRKGLFADVSVFDFAVTCLQKGCSSVCYCEKFDFMLQICLWAPVCQNPGLRLVYPYKAGGRQICKLSNNPELKTLYRYRETRGFIDLVVGHNRVRVFG